MTIKLLQTPVVQAEVVVAAQHVYEDVLYLVKVEEKGRRDMEYIIYPEGYADMSLVVRIRAVYERNGYSKIVLKIRYGFKVYNNMDSYVTLDVQSSFRTQLVEFGMDLDDNDGNPFNTMEYTAKAMLNYLGLDQPKKAEKVRKPKKKKK